MKPPGKRPHKKFSLREFNEDDSYVNEQQEYQRRQLYDYLLSQLEEN